ncbi:MAG: LysR family transcriptional regulator [Azoarcus sp.]|nr:LysR family transcriptional regulator [Azoarcus sp.]
MELKQLRYFIVVAEELNFRRAAERLHLTQPPLSQQIKALEKALGVDLFIRNTHNVALTRAGQILLQQAYRLQADVQHSCQLVRQAQEGFRGVFHLGYSQSCIFSGRLGNALAHLLGSRPHLQVRLREGCIAQLLDEVKSHRLDAAIIRGRLAADEIRPLSCRVLGEEPLHVFVCPHHRLASASSIRLSDLLEERLLLQPASKNTALRRQTIVLAERAGHPLGNLLEVGEIASMLCLIKANVGVALLPGSVAGLSADVVGIPLSDEETSYPVLLLAGSDHPAVEALRQFVVSPDGAVGNGSP